MNGDWDVERGRRWRAKRWLWSGAVASAAGAVFTIVLLVLPGPLWEWTIAILSLFWAAVICFAWTAVRYLLRARVRGP